MPSILPTFEYDIFISYRHNDNRSGWVTEFVNALQEELAATIKEPLTIYFDQNPHDGLLETHNVDKSLEGKLKCLIFIPIISQTYCDTKSFAWQHEFVAFNKLAKEDQFGRDIKLSNGNVTSRILSIRIHDLDPEDKSIIETEIGGVLRAIDFINKEPGVNRSLKISDDRNVNLNKTDYRNQINKTANAVKEIVQALKKPAPPDKKRTADEPTNHSANKSTLKLVGGVVVLFLLFLVAYLMWQKSDATVISEKTLDRTIAVLPFIDLSELKDQEWFTDGLTEEILNSLAHVDSLSVISRTSSFAFKNKNLPIQRIADSLHVNFIVEGSVRKSNTSLRITAQLIRARDGVHLWSNSYDRNSRDIFEVQQDIASKIVEALDISLDPSAVESMHWAGTKNADAYLAFLKGIDLSLDAHYGKGFDLKLMKEANSFFEEAIALDPEFVSPYLNHSDLYHHIIIKDTPFSQDTTSDEFAYKMLKNDLDNAIAHSKNEAQRNLYEIFRIMFSDDWSRLNEAIEKILNDPTSYERLKFQMIDIESLITLVGHGDRMAAINKTVLEKDTYNGQAKFQLLSNYLFHGQNREAVEFCQRVGAFNIYTLMAMYHEGMYNEINQRLEKAAPRANNEFLDMQALMLANKGSLSEAKALMKEKRQMMASYLFAVDKIFGREEANRLASAMDKKPIIHYHLLRSLIVSPTKPPFDLNATPNFARRLKQAGVPFIRK